MNSREQVREQVMERVRIFGPGNGFVFSQIHNIQFEVPPANVPTMVDTAMECGSYPIK